ITDGTGSTMNGDDRWTDALSHRLHALYGRRVAVVNAGIGGNRVTTPARYSIDAPIPGGPSALERLERDLLAISGLRAAIWLEGINDIGTGEATADQITAGLRSGVARIRSAGVRAIGATIVSALGADTPHGTARGDAIRRAVNDWIRAPGSYDAVVDFDAATRDPATGALRPEFQPNGTIGGPGDRLHPNRAGYLAMAAAVDPAILAIPPGP
ncbi:MAG: lysophospholipase, partial [Alphaproteobacteria bacterium]|nr:lysophospholipase [Alphaproteobacteria bacterium]